MIINATLVNLYHVCTREMWLHANGIRMEHTSEVVAEGKLIGETTYPQRAAKYEEVELSASLNSYLTLAGKVDFYDARRKVVHETKKSDKAETAHEWQVKFYLWLLTLNGVKDATGILEYPKLRHISHIQLTADDHVYLQQAVEAVQKIVEDETCPPRINSTICKSCSYYEFCYVEEIIE